MMTILIVDDEYLIRELIDSYIAPYRELFQVICKAASAHEAMAVMQRQTPDVVITDIDMPAVDGLTMSQQIMEKYPNVKIIILTVYDDFKYAQKGIRLGVYDYLLKPIDEEQLISTLKALKAGLETPRLQKAIGDASQSADPITKIENYVREHMAEPSLSLKGIAETFYMNASYLSRLFKQKRKIAFNEYLNTLRIKTAQELMKTADMKVYEISELVGIQDPNYFSYLFKKYTNMSITQYRNVLRTDD